MHATNAGEKRKALKREALELARRAKTTMKAAKTLPEARRMAHEFQGEADKILAESEALKDQARLEDLHVWAMEKIKTTKKGRRTYHYWMATWREGGKVRNFHLGSCAKMDAKAALRKAKEMKADALAINL